jgi:hypothetical protein
MKEDKLNELKCQLDDLKSKKQELISQILDVKALMSKEAKENFSIYKDKWFQLPCDEERRDIYFKPMYMFYDTIDFSFEVEGILVEIGDQDVYVKNDYRKRFSKDEVGSLLEAEINYPPYNQTKVKLDELMKLW